jgi:hypothetical protein
MFHFSVMLSVITLSVVMANVVAPDVSDASTNTCWQKKVFFNVVNETKKHLRKMTPSSLFVYGCSNQIKYTENQGEK